MIKKKLYASVASGTQYTAVHFSYIIKNLNLKMNIVVEMVVNSLSSTVVEVVVVIVVAVVVKVVVYTNTHKDFNDRKLVES